MISMHAMLANLMCGGEMFLFNMLDYQHLTFWTLMLRQKSVLQSNKFS